jgi:precorrin-2/cobalt-factor-2 C20-methyltransferase
MTGTLHGLGVGPGDPELLTLKALRILQAVPVIAYPVLGKTPSFAREIVAGHLSGRQREIAMEVPLGGHHRTGAAYDAAAARIAEALGAGDDVAVLCEGDPMLYGSFIYIRARLIDRFECEIIPGVSSLTAAPARLGHPIAAGDDCVAILPATLPDDVLARRLADADSAVIMKLGRHLPRIRALLGRLGLAGRADYIERATLPGERAMPLTDLADDPAPYFSMILVRPAAGDRR